MRYVSLCSGVEATTVAWSKLGWTPLAFAEIDPFACAVLAHRYPDVPNLGDISGIDWKEFHERHGIIDVLFASTPCQSFSIAGNRLGLDGESGLMLEFVRAVRELVTVSGGGEPEVRGLGERSRSTLKRPQRLEGGRLPMPARSPG